MKLIVTIITLLTIFLTSSVDVFAQIDQKRGIHILHPEEIDTAHQLLNFAGSEHKSYVTIPFTLAD